MYSLQYQTISRPAQVQEEVEEWSVTLPLVSLEKLPYFNDFLHLLSSFLTVFNFVPIEVHLTVIEYYIS